MMLMAPALPLLSCWARETHLSRRRDELVEPGERDEEQFVDRADAGLAQTAGDGERAAADRQRVSGLLGAARADEQGQRVARGLLPLREPGLHREVPRRIIGDEIDGAPLRAGAHETLRRDLRDARKGAQRLAEASVEIEIGRLHREQSARDVHQRALRHDDEIGAHARETGRHAVAQGPAENGARKDDADGDHHRETKKEASQPSPPDILRGEPKQEKMRGAPSRHVSHGFDGQNSSSPATIDGAANEAPHAPQGSAEAAASHGRAAAVDKLLIVARDDHAVMVTAEVREIADRLQRILREDEGSALHALEAAEDRQHIFSVVGNMHGLGVDADILEALDRRPRVGVDDDDGALRRLLVQLRDEHLRAVHGIGDMEGTRRGAHPMRVLEVPTRCPFARVAI